MSEALSRLRQRVKEDNQSKYKEASRDRLKTIAQKKLKTSFIGALAKFEEAFGSLWGHGKKADERTPDEQEMYDIWQTCRTDILNNGNNQIRSLLTEIDMQTVEWNRHSVTIPTVDSPAPVRTAPKVDTIQKEG